MKSKSSIWTEKNGSNYTLKMQRVSVSHLSLALRDMVSWYEQNKNKFKPLVLAAIIHNQFEYVHPFQDGNGRVGRLLLNFILLKRKYPPISINLEDRAEYYRTLHEYQKNQNLKPTVEFLVKQYKKTLRKVTTRK
ncbi:Fic family protein [Candidatus Woesearchaeota archaeon]|nr:Fic family protein [Candidatus Woesearchaeota archaeon]